VGFARFGSIPEGILRLAALAAASAAAAQSSPICQFVVATVVATEIELGEAKKELRRCERLGQASCASERGRIRDLRRRLKLLLDDLDKRCTR
jgi:hypothetical protein